MVYDGTIRKSDGGFLYAIKMTTVLSLTTEPQIAVECLRHSNHP